MTSSLACSVIIPTYNRVDMLRDTLESLARQSLPTSDFEVLVVDDGSSDETGTMVREFDGRLHLKYFFQEDEGWRTAAARNIGLRHAQGEVSVFVDSGILAHTGCLAAHVDSHRRAEGPVAVVGYVYCLNLDNEDASLIDEAIDVTDPDGTIRRFEETKRWLDIREWFYDRFTDDFGDLPAPWTVYWTCNVSANTAQVREVGLFDENLRRWGGEDLDLAYRLHRAGARFVLNRQANAVHVPHPKSFAANNEAANQNYEYLVEKYGNTPILRLLLEFPKGDNQSIDSVNPFTMNDVIRERGLPSCAEYLAAQGSAR